MRRVLLVTAAIAAAVAVWLVLVRPRRAIALDASWDDGSVPGLLHIHSNRSDGRGDLEEIAAAAAAAGLRFIIVTDHGDGTRTPEPPAYRSGVLCLDAVEISTTGGHYLAFGLGATPYPLGGEPRDIVDDVRRMGGFGVAAHPDSPKAALAWQDWTLPVGGLEILNPDSSWRSQAFERGVAGKAQLLKALTTYPARPSETIGALLTNSPDARARWDALARERPVVGLAGVDAHARLELIATDPDTERLALPIPGYESSFRALSVRVQPREPLTGDADADAPLVLDAIKSGRLYTAVDAWATPPRFSFEAIGAQGRAGQGESLVPADDIVLKVRHNGPASFTTTILRNGQAVDHDASEGELSVHAAAGEGHYRVEIRDPAHPGGPPWITSNPIYIRTPQVTVAAPSVSPSALVARLFDDTTTGGWTIESDAVSLAAINVAKADPTSGTGALLHIRYGLATGGDTGQFSGVAVTAPQEVAAADRVAFSLRAEHPMRLSVQVRAAGPGGSAERWQRSVYVDDTMQPQVVRFSDMTPVGSTSLPTPPIDRVEAIMFIVNTTNTAPGQSGHLWLGGVRLERP